MDIILKKTGVGISLLMLMLSLSLIFDFQPAKAIGTIYIKADGSISSPTAPIQREGNVYTRASPSVRFIPARDLLFH